MAKEEKNEIEDNEIEAKDWPHAPLHRLDTNGVFMITAATLYKKKLFQTSEKLSLLENTLLSHAKRYHWRLEAWAVFANHYHLLACSEEGALELDRMVKQVHDDTARELNRMDQAEGRSIWYNFWDTKLTFQRSYLARLNYVHQNPVKHGLVKIANQYRWGSAAWFERTASTAMVKTIYSFKMEKLKIFDDF